MKRWGLAAIALSAAMFAAGCASVTLAPAGPYKAGASYSVTLGRAWSDITAASPNLQDGVRVLSIDGPLLNRLFLAVDIAPGQGVIKPPRRETRAPVYRADMTSREISEMLLETLSGMNYQKVEEVELNPGKFLDGAGVRVTFKAQTKEGLEMSALAVAAPRNGKLQAILFVAPSEYYFQRDLPEVERIISSVVAP